MVSGTLAQPAILVTLTKEMAYAIPYVTQIRQIGDVSAYGRIAMAMAAVIWAYLGERAPRKRLLIAGGFLSTFPFLLAIVAPSYPLLFWGHVTSFVGRAAFLALSPTIVMDMIPKAARGQALSVVGIAGLAGAGVGTILPSLLVDSLSWQVPMLIVGLYCLAGLVVLFSIRIPARGAQEGPSSPSPQDTLEVPPGPRLSALRRVFSVPSNLSFTLYFLLLQASVGGIGYYVFTIFKEEYGLGAPVTMAIVMGAQSLTMIGTGFWATRSDESVRKSPDGRVRTLLIASLVAAVFQALAYLVLPSYRISPWLLSGYILFSLVSSFASLSALTPLMDTIVGDTNPVEIRALAISLRNLAGVLAAGLGILFIGWMQEAQGTFTWATIILSTAALLSVLFLIPARKSAPREMAALDLSRGSRLGPQGEVGRS